MLIENSNIQFKFKEDVIYNTFINLDKHYPFFKLFDLATIIKEGDFEATINTRYGYLGHNFLFKSTNDKLLISFLNQERTSTINSIPYSVSRYYLRNVHLELTRYNNLKQFSWLSNHTIKHSTLTLGNNNEFAFLLCIKPEYIYYVKLCYLTNTEIDYDCFYILAKEKATHTYSTTYHRMYRYIVKYIKDYGIEVRYVDSIEKELSMSIELPKFKTIKGYNEWLLDIKNKFIESINPKTIVNTQSYA